MKFSAIENHAIFIVHQRMSPNHHVILQINLSGVQQKDANGLFNGPLGM